MAELPFYFKKFVIHQDKCAMKVGTDAVLIGSCADASGANTILDIGTGTGVIAIMMAQKSNASIDAIDIDKTAYDQAKENAAMCPWNDRISVIHQSLQNYAPICRKKYDLIVSNPPYFVDASKGSEAARNIARHTDTLPFDDLIKGVKLLLNDTGHFCVIFPTNEGTIFCEKAEKQGLHITELMRVKTKADKQEKRMLIRFEFVKKPLKEGELVIQNEDLTYTDSYIELTKDFYLGLK